MMPLPSTLGGISLRGVSSPLTRRRTSIESQKLPGATGDIHHSRQVSPSRRRIIKIAIAWIVVVFFAVKIFSHTARRPVVFDDEETHEVTPYAAQRASYVKPAAEWLADRMYDARTNMHKHVRGSRLLPKSMRNIGLGRSTIRFGSPPHQPLNFPSFQAKMYKLTAPDWDKYEERLTRFARDAFPNRLARWSVSELRRNRRKRSFNPIPQRVWQTGRVLPHDARSFMDENPKASYNFYTDPLLENWASTHFNNSRIKDCWDGMERVVLKTDFWRYLVTYLEGGFYSDLDTDCLKPVHHWGRVDVVKWDLGNDLTPQAVLDAPPQVVVGIEVDVPDITGWETFWPRPIQIVQWTMAGAPGHPIYLDAIRRVVESMEKVKEWDEKRKAEARRILAQLTAEEAAEASTTTHGSRSRLQRKNVLQKVEKLLAMDPFDSQGGGVMSLIEATGPGAFSDAVFSYLQARYGIHWSQLHNIQTATRIGDVAILPITGFAPFQRPDWQRWKGIDRGPMAVVGDVTHPQAMVYHHFSGSWRTSTDNSA